jgi:hypothetical protein
MSTTNPNTRTMKVVYAITERAPGKSYWTRIGVGFVNQDGSINLRLECLPFGPNTSMQIRDYDARDAERDSEQNLSGSRSRVRREPLDAGALA